MRIEDAQACPRFAARVIDGIDARAPTPAWMKSRIERCGIRSISAIVDITNYVMLECGQPLHAFDFDLLQGKRIFVRRAAKGETIKAIDQKIYALSPEMCVIADANRPVTGAVFMGQGEPFMNYDAEIGTAHV